MTLPEPWPRLLDVLVCPLCGGGLHGEPGELRCGSGHAFDIARQGYVGLLTGKMQAGSADTAPMVQARVDFLQAGHYAPLAAALAELAAAHCPPEGIVVDAGAGTGYYLGRLLDALPGAAGLALDISKFALRRAAKAHPRLSAATWDVWQPLPLRSGSADLLLNVFAPRNGPEFHRILAPGGTLLVVTPTSRHLAELRESRGLLSVDEAKEERLARTLAGHFSEEHTERLEYVLSLTAQDAGNLVGMGPNAFHRESAAATELPAAVTASFQVSVYRPR